MRIFHDQNLSGTLLQTTLALFLLPLCTSLGVTLYHSPDQESSHEVYASTPSFGLQQINDDLLLIQGNDNNTQTTQTTKTTSNSDLHEIDYFSNGETLNATFWLFRDNTSQIQQVQQQLSSQSLFKTSLRFGVLIDIDSNSQTGFKGADYDSYIEFSNGNWTQYLYQISTMGIFRLIDVQHLNVFPSLQL